MQTIPLHEHLQDMADKFPNKIASLFTWSETLQMYEQCETWRRTARALLVLLYLACGLLTAALCALAVLS